jgi:hypothetical protein
MPPTRRAGHLAMPRWSTVCSPGHKGQHGSRKSGGMPAEARAHGEPAGWPPPLAPQPGHRCRPGARAGHAPPTPPCTPLALCRHAARPTPGTSAGRCAGRAATTKACRHPGHMQICIVGLPGPPPLAGLGRQVPLPDHQHLLVKQRPRRMRWPAISGRLGRVGIGPPRNHPICTSVGRPLGLGAGGSRGRGHSGLMHRRAGPSPHCGPARAPVRQGLPAMPGPLAGPCGGCGRPLCDPHVHHIGGPNLPPILGCGPGGRGMLSEQRRPARPSRPPCPVPAGLARQGGLASDCRGPGMAWCGTALGVARCRPGGPAPGGRPKSGGAWRTPAPSRGAAGRSPLSGPVGPARRAWARQAIAADRPGPACATAARLALRVALTGRGSEGLSGRPGGVPNRGQWARCGQPCRSCMQIWAGHPGHPVCSAGQVIVNGRAPCQWARRGLGGNNVQGRQCRWGGRRMILPNTPAVATGAAWASTCCPPCRASLAKAS